MVRAKWTHHVEPFLPAPGEHKVGRGQVRVGQKRPRGVRGATNTTADGYLNVDVTSGSMNKIGGERAKTLSPLTLGPYTDSSGATAHRFENYWQYGKLWPRAGHIQAGTRCDPTPAWTTFRDRGYASTAAKGKRRPLPRATYGSPTCARYFGREWVEARKLVYVPGYLSLIRKLPVVRELKRLLDRGQNIMIIDGDGPPKSLYPHGMPMTVANWNRMIKDTNHSFGHGYVVAALIAGLLQ